MGSDTTVKGKGICEAVEVILSGWKVVANFLPLELRGVEVVLGMQWLYSLGITEVDWKNLTMTFIHKGKIVVIKGDPSLTKSRASLKKMMKTWDNSDQGFLVECCVVEGRLVIREEDDLEEVLKVEESVAVVSKKYEDVFTWPEKLLPRREIEHHIHMKKDIDPVNVRPYHYAYQQKIGMEKLVEEMLTSGIIRPNNYLYSSPVLLVRKKDKLAVLR